MRLGLTVLFCALFLAAGLSFYGAFPTDHSWSEMLLNYQGGFLKRSLLGEVAYRLHPFIPAQTSVSVIMIALYCAVAIWAVRLCVSRLSVATVLFLASPAGLLFAIHDPQVFGRKDIVIIAAFAASSLIVERVKDSTTAIASILALYLVTGLVIEVAWLYMPIALMLLVITHKPDRLWQLRALAGLLFYAALIYPLATAYPGGDPERGIIAAWAKIHPSVMQNALCCVGVNFEQASSMARSTLEQAGAGYALSFALSIVPLACLMPYWRPRLDRLSALGLVAAILISFVPLALAADWGRYIYLMTFQLFALLAITSEPPKPMSRRAWALTLIVAALYGTTWTMPHFHVGILPGPLLR